MHSLLLLKDKTPVLIRNLQLKGHSYKHDGAIELVVNRSAPPLDKTTMTNGQFVRKVATWVCKALDVSSWRYERVELQPLTSVRALCDT